MRASLGEMPLEEAAKQAAGNWRNFECFAWFRQNELIDADQWAVLYTHHRDSGLLDRSNAAVIEKALEPFTEGDDPDVIVEDHSHWAVGWIAGFSVRVYRNGGITEAFRAYHALAERLAEYPVLDEEDHSRREYEATLTNITDAVWQLEGNFDLPDGWESDVFSWLWENRQHALESRDDQGGYPEAGDMEAAFEALGYRLLAEYE